MYEALKESRVVRSAGHSFQPSRLCANIAREGSDSAYAPAPSKTPSSFVTINYGNATTSSIPDAFGGNNLPGNSTWQQNLINSGIKMIRSSYYISRIVPNTTLDAYRSCMATGTPNVCDPKTWTWNLSPVPGMQAATALGQRVMAIMCYNVPFDSTTRNQFGTIQDYDIYEDIVKKMVQHYTPSMIEVGNEPDGSCSSS